MLQRVADGQNWPDAVAAAIPRRQLKSFPRASAGGGGCPVRTVSLPPTQRHETSLFRLAPLD